MDSITQGLLGATVAECGFRHRLGRGATLMGALAGVLPDLDIFLGWLNPWWTWQYHRHFTHSVLFAPVVAFPLAWLFWRRRGFRNRYWLWYLCALLALGTHPILDILTTYGTYYLVPFSNTRLGLDWIAIIDPAYTLILIVTLLACAVGRWRGDPSKTWQPAAVGLSLSVAYLAYGGLNHAWAMERLDEHIQAKDHEVLAARAIPNIGSVYVWRLIYRTPEGYWVGRTNTRYDGEPEFHFLPKAEDPLIAEANKLPEVRLFRRFTMGWARPFLTRSETGPAVVYDDLRYGWPPDRPRSLWSTVVQFDRKGNVVSVYRASNRAEQDRTVGELWRSFWWELKKP